MQSLYRFADCVLINNTKIIKIVKIIKVAKIIKVVKIVKIIWMKEF